MSITLTDKQAAQLFDRLNQQRALALETLQASYFLGVCSVCGTDLATDWVESTRFKDTNPKFISGIIRCPNLECDAEK